MVLQKAHAAVHAGHGHAGGFAFEEGLVRGDDLHAHGLRFGGLRKHLLAGLTQGEGPVGRLGLGDAAQGQQGDGGKAHGGAIESNVPDRRSSQC